MITIVGGGVEGRIEGRIFFDFDFFLLARRAFSFVLGTGTSAGSSLFGTDDDAA